MSLLLPFERHVHLILLDYLERRHGCPWIPIKFWIGTLVPHVINCTLLGQWKQGVQFWQCHKGMSHDMTLPASSCVCNCTACCTAVMSSHHEMGAEVTGLLSRQCESSAKRDCILPHRSPPTQVPPAGPRTGTPNGNQSVQEPESGTFQILARVTAFWMVTGTLQKNWHCWRARKDFVFRPWDFMVYLKQIKLHCCPIGMESKHNGL